MEEDVLISDEVLEGPEFTQKVEGTLVPKDGILFRVAEVIPLWWGGVANCGSDDRMRQELSGALGRWVAVQVETRPDATLVEHGHERPALRIVTKHPIGGRRKCSVNGSMPCWAMFLKKV